MLKLSKHSREEILCFLSLRCAALVETWNRSSDWWQTELVELEHQCHHGFRLRLICFIIDDSTSSISLISTDTPSIGSMAAFIDGRSYAGKNKPSLKHHDELRDNKVVEIVGNTCDTFTFDSSLDFFSGNRCFPVSSPKLDHTCQTIPIQSLKCNFNKPLAAAGRLEGDEQTALLSPLN